MGELVFLKSTEIHEEPYTTSRVIAEHSGNQHHTVTKLIQTYQSDLEEFGRVRFEIDTLQTNGGAQESKYYLLNEEQSTLIITYMKNSERVRTFKKNLVREFFKMKRDQVKRQITREVTRKDRKNLTETIKDKYPEKKWMYKHYTDLDYKCVLGMSAKKFEETYNIPDGKLRDYLAADQLQQIGILEAANKALLEAGYTYEEIKDILSRKFIDRKTG